MNSNPEYILSEEHRKMVVHIMHTGAFLDSKITKILKAFGITHVQFNILKVLEHKDPVALSVGELKKGILFTNSDITRLLDRLVTKNLIERNICTENRRQIDVSITKSGLDLLKQISPSLLQLTDSFCANLFSEDEAKQISNNMKNIRHNG